MSEKGLGRDGQGASWAYDGFSREGVARLEDPRIKADTEKQQGQGVACNEVMLYCCFM